MTYSDYLNVVEGYRVKHPTQRRGQAMFNVLWNLRPELGEAVQGSLCDPFYNDAKIPAFLERVEASW